MSIGFKFFFHCSAAQPAATKRGALLAARGPRCLQPSGEKPAEPGRGQNTSNRPSSPPRVPVPSSGDSREPWNAPPRLPPAEAPGEALPRVISAEQHAAGHGAGPPDELSAPSRPSPSVATPPAATLCPSTAASPPRPPTQVPGANRTHSPDTGDGFATTLPPKGRPSTRGELGLPVAPRSPAQLILKPARRCRGLLVVCSSRGVFGGHTRCFPGDLSVYA